MKGFTLVEVLVSTAILAVIFAGISLVLITGDKTWHYDMGLLDLQQQARQAMDGIVRECRQASLSTLSITENGARLDFSIPNISNPVAYLLSNNQIIRQHAAEEKILANDINALNFCCWHNGNCDSDCSVSNTLQVQIEAAKSALNRPISFSLTQKVRLRND